MSLYACLPGNARHEVAAKVLGILLGCPAHLGGVPKARWAEVHGASVESSAMHECVQIVVRAPAGTSAFLWHFEGRGSGRIVSCHESLLPALCGLVDFYGGHIESDGGSKRLHSAPVRTDEENCPEGGAPWDALQARILAVRPLAEAYGEQAIAATLADYISHPGRRAALRDYIPADMLCPSCDDGVIDTEDDERPCTRCGGTGLLVYVPVPRAAWTGESEEPCPF